jgi:phenylalanyl-tRNA synthetase beta chain
MSISLKLSLLIYLKYPEVRRDLALLVDQSVNYDSIYAIAKTNFCKSLLKEINLFDV